MASDDKPKIMLWDVELWENWSARVSSMLSVETLDPETRFALIGSVGSYPYIHIAEDDEDTRLVTVLAVIASDEGELPSDAVTRFPQAGMWLSTVNRGIPRVVGASRLLTRVELAEVLGGHAPPPSPTTTKSS